MMVTIFYNYYAPAYKAGGPIQSLVNLVTQLNSSELRIVCSNRDLDGSFLNVPANKWITNSITSVYYSAKGFSSIVKVISKEDTLFLNGIYSVNYNFLPALFMPGRKIISVRGMLHPNALLQKPFKKKVYLFIWKLFALHRKCEYHATSEHEKEYIQTVLGNEVKVWVIPNLPKPIHYQKLPSKSVDQLIVSTIALISPMKNHLIVLQALKRCKATITYNIYGPIKDIRYWDKCKKVIEEMPSNISVQYHGEIHPEMITEALAKSHLIIQPSMSENFGHSILEALLAGRPVVTSFNTPWNNLQNSQAGINTFPKIIELQNAISFFSEMDEIELKQWSVQAREYALNALDVQQIKKQYRQMLKLNE